MLFVISQYFHLITKLVKSQLYNGTIYSGQLIFFCMILKLFSE